MFEALVILFVVAGLWLALMCAGFIFKLLFGLIGGVFAVVGALVFLGVAGALSLALLPVTLFALAPFWLPLAMLGVLVWLLLRGSRRPARAAGPRYPR